MVQSLTFNDGTTFENSRAMEMGKGLYVYFGSSISMVDVLLTLADSEKTSKIQYNYNKVTLTFEGYTKPVTINDDGAAIAAILAKDGANNGK